MYLAVSLPNQPLASLVNFRTKAALLSGLCVHPCSGLFEDLLLSPVQKIVDSSITNLIDSSMVDRRAKCTLLKLVNVPIWIRVPHILHHLVVRFSLRIPKMYWSSTFFQVILSYCRLISHLSHFILNLFLP